MKKKNNLIKNYKSGDSIFFIDRERVAAAYINSYLAASINSKYIKKLLSIVILFIKIKFLTYTKSLVLNFLLVELIVS